MTVVERAWIDRRSPVAIAAVRSPLAWVTIADNILRARVTSLLRRAGYAIVELPEPGGLIDALSLAMAPEHRVRRPTLAVIDLDPIGSDPVDLLTAMRCEAPGLPIIALIDDTDIEVFEQASRLEVNVLFVKPFELELMRTAAMTFATLR